MSVRAGELREGPFFNAACAVAVAGTDNECNIRLIALPITVPGDLTGDWTGFEIFFETIEPAQALKNHLLEHSGVALVCCL